MEGGGTLINNILTLESRDQLFSTVPRLIEHFGNAFHLLWRDGIVRAHFGLKEAMGLEGYNNFLATKANPNLSVLQVAHNIGSGIDCSSIFELKLGQMAGFKNERIIFTSNGSGQKQWDVAGETGAIMNFDDIEALKQFSKLAPNVIVCFRYNCGPGRDEETNAFIGKPEEQKYGVPDHKIEDAFALAIKKGARRFGLHTMFASNSLEYRVLVRTTQMLLEVAERVGRKFDINFEFINIGGGIGIPYFPSQDAFDIHALGLEARATLAEFEKRNGYKPKLFTESGRYILGPNGVLIMKVVGIEEKYQKIARVEASTLATIPRAVIYSGSYHHILILDEAGCIVTGEEEPWAICGPLCENLDYFTATPNPDGEKFKTRLLPRIKKGYHVVVCSTGAHGSAMASEYNCHPRVPEIMISRTQHGETRFQLIRRGTTFEDFMLQMIDLPAVKTITL